MKKLAFIGIFMLLVLSVPRAHADNLPNGCAAGDNFSSVTGQPCTSQTDCQPGDLFSSETGLPCSSNYLPGCLSTKGFSITTGNKCDGSSPLQQLTQSINALVQRTMTAGTAAVAPLQPSEVPVMPTITKQLIPNNRAQVFSIKTNVPTTATIEYVDETALIAAQGPLFTGGSSATYVGGRNGMDGLLIPYIANPANVSTYTDTALTTDHEISYASLSLVPNDLYDTNVTVTDANGNSYTFSGYSNPADPTGALNSWDTSFNLSTNKNA